MENRGRNCESYRDHENEGRILLLGMIEETLEKGWMALGRLVSEESRDTRLGWGSVDMEKAASQCSQRSSAHFVVGKSKRRIQRKPKLSECAGKDLYWQIVGQQVGKLGTQQLKEASLCFCETVSTARLYPGTTCGLYTLQLLGC